MENNKLNQLLKIDTIEKLKAFGIKKVKVIYSDAEISQRSLFYYFFMKKRIIKVQNKKTFKLEYWLAFKDTIIKNLYNKGLCKIEFIR